MHQLADTLRAEAQKQIAATTVDSSSRRALLRKAKPSPVDEYVIGDTLAYWRWTAGSGKKRGGYKLARMWDLTQTANLFGFSLEPTPSRWLVNKPERPIQIHQILALRMASLLNPIHTRSLAMMTISETLSLNLRHFKHYLHFNNKNLNLHYR